MHRLSAFSVIMVFVLLTVAGAALLPLVNFQFTPSTSAPGITAAFRWPNAPARLVEQEATLVLEGLFSTLKGLKEVRSVSEKGGGRVTATFQPGTDMDMARFEAATLARQAFGAFPEGATYPSLSLGTGGRETQPVLTYSLNAPEDPHFIQRYADRQLVPRIAQIDGVGKVEVYGGVPYEWEIRYDEALAAPLGITGGDIAHALTLFFQKHEVGKARIGTKGENVQVSLLGGDFGGTGWQRIPLKKTGGRTVFLGDVAKARFLQKKPDRYFRVNGRNTVNMVVYPEEGGNILRIAPRAVAAIDRLAGALPDGYALTLTRDASKYLRDEIGKIAARALLSLAGLLVFVLAVSRSWRYLLLVVTGLAANLLTACILFYFLGVSIHLYSLAGIAISFGMVVDSGIVMIDHVRHHGNRKAFIAILGATLTTIGALAVIFLLEEAQRANLEDFAWVVAINLGVSLAVALFFIPALMEKVPLRQRRNRIFYRRKRRAARFAHFYSRLIVLGNRWRWALLLVGLLGFGLPVHWLPERLGEEGETGTFWEDVYDSSLGSESGRDALRALSPWVGGALRLFSQYVYENATYRNPDRTALHVRAAMPEGSTVQQLDTTVRKMEAFISDAAGVELFWTSINSYRNASISILFTGEAEHRGTPYHLKAQLEAKAIALGGADWSVYGVGQGFSNALGTEFGSHHLFVRGYNYDALYGFADMLRKNLLAHPRVKRADIRGEVSWRDALLHEYHLGLSQGQLALQGIPPSVFHRALGEKAYRSALPPVPVGGERYPLVLASEGHGHFDQWDMANLPVATDSASFKLGVSGKLEKRRTGNDIHKIDQEYQLAVSYDFIGPYALQKKFREQEMEKLQALLPLGYRVETYRWAGWDKGDSAQYYLLGLVLLIVFLTCSILLESVRQPLSVIALVPLSFIGIFLTFYLFDVNFDQGGFASFVLVSGLVVNAALYLLNDYNNGLKTGRGGALKHYLKAFNGKIIPVLLTVASTLLGLLPFVVLGEREPFWFSFAAGTIGGITFSLPALLLYLPLLVPGVGKVAQRP